MWLKKIKMAVRMLAKSKLVSINLWLNVHLVPPVQTWHNGFWQNGLQKLTLTTGGKETIKNIYKLKKEHLNSKSSSN